MESSQSSSSNGTTTTTIKTTKKMAFAPRTVTTAKGSSSAVIRRTVNTAAMSRSSAPMVSSAKQNRVKEKKELQDLNERFAKYIEKVRFLEAQNKKLVKELETLRGSWGNETREIKHRYQTELAESRAEVNDALRQKAQLEIQIQSIQEDFSDTKDDYATVKKNYEELSKALQREHTQLSEYESEVGLLRRRVGFLEEENGRLKKKVTEQADEIVKLRALVDTEQLERIHAENRVRSLEEELEFLKTVHDQELKELSALAYKDTTAENREYWKSELAVAIRDLQAEYDSKLDSIKSELESNYASKISQIQTGSVRSSLEVEQSREETKKSRDRLHGLRNQLLDVERQVAHWKSLYEDKSAEIDEKERNWDVQMHELQTNYAELEVELEKVRAELDDILDAKLSMELEISAYRSLLDGDQSSLKRCVTDWLGSGDVSQTDSQSSLFGKIVHQVKDFVNPEDKQSQVGISRSISSSSNSSQISMKTTVHKTSKGSLAVEETSPDGAYAIVRNKGDKIEKLNGWSLKRTVDGKQDVHCNFKNVELNIGKTIRVVVKDFKDKVPGDLLFEGKPASMGTSVVLTLFNSNAEEQATLVMKNVYI